ncbi:MAG: amidohydrolase family protein, partial [Bifidobacterium mongoliense]|nr:amidohydrolase family protein [Bifidobacterium mongoliense]
DTARSEERTVVATSDAADSMRIGDQAGRLIAGSSADFIVIKGRPWERIDDLDVNNIVAVVSKGRVVSGSIEGLRG